MGQPRLFEDAIAKFHRAAEADTTLIAPALLWAAWSHVNLGQRAYADVLVDRVTPRRDQLAPGDLLMLDLLVSGHLRSDPAMALRVARQVGGIDLPVAAYRYNRPMEAIQALESITPNWYDYWFFLTGSYHMLGDHEGELAVARTAREADPDLVSHVYLEVRALSALDRVEEVNQTIDESLTLQPEWNWRGVQSVVMIVAANELRAHGNRAASIQVAERAIGWLAARPADEAATRLHRQRLAKAYYLAERWEEAGALYEGLARESPGLTAYQGALAALAARRGDRQEALRLGEGLVGTAGRYEFGVEPYYQARIAALLGERERATSLFREALARGLRIDSYDPHAEMDLESMRDYGPFQELLRPKG
jgi:tetratricopeptide (TPR) repeat protein